MKPSDKAVEAAIDAHNATPRDGYTSPMLNALYAAYRVDFLNSESDQKLTTSTASILCYRFKQWGTPEWSGWVVGNMSEHVTPVRCIYQERIFNVAVQEIER